MGRYISPGGNAELWNEKPEGYFTEKEWAAGRPAPVATAENERLARMALIDAELEKLDFKSIRPLRDIESGSADAMDRAALLDIQKQVEVLREERRALAGASDG